MSLFYLHFWRVGKILVGIKSRKTVVFQQLENAIPLSVFHYFHWQVDNRSYFCTFQSKVYFFHLAILKVLFCCLQFLTVLIWCVFLCLDVFHFENSLPYLFSCFLPYYFSPPQSGTPTKYTFFLPFSYCSYKLFSIFIPFITQIQARYFLVFLPDHLSSL